MRAAAAGVLAEGLPVRMRRLLSAAQGEIISAVLAAVLAGQDRMAGMGALAVEVEEEVPTKTAGMGAQVPILMPRTVQAVGPAED
jgi:hypothetical protein